MSTRRRLLLVLLALALIAAAAFVLARPWIERQIVAVLGDASVYAAAPGALSPAFTGRDADRPRIQIALRPLVTGLAQPVDIQFVPGQPDVMLVVQKGGQVLWIDRQDPARRGVLLEEPRVITAVEQGMLGLALHHDFARDGRLYTNTTIQSADGREVSQIREWTTAPGADLRQVKAAPARVLMEIEQPYQNHNAGQLAFGPDKKLYIGWGDGGLADDPQGHGQDTMTPLGAMLRIDVDAAAPPGQPYAIPPDNPFLKRPDVLPEIWAYGFRNPWRFSFAPDGRLIVADVGQDRWEEIAVVAAGQNHGWKIKEGDRCFSPPKGCDPAGLTDPIYTYPHDEGQSVTGGFVYTGALLPALKGHYVFGDFVSGRLWAFPLPSPGQPVKPGAVSALGQWPVLLSSFGQDERGELYLADLTQGRILQALPPTP
jgi:glucose/arabinose dehydrogenase